MDIEEENKKITNESIGKIRNEDIDQNKDKNINENEKAVGIPETVSTVRNKSIEDLLMIKENLVQKIAGYQYRVLICSGAGCVSSNCQEVKAALVKAINDFGISEQIQVVETGCIGTCALGPVMVVMPEGVVYTKLKPADMRAIADAHLKNGNIKIENTYFDRKTNKNIPLMKDIPYFMNMVRIALRNCGNIDYLSLEEYIASDGYLAAAKTLKDMTPLDVIKEVKKSGLRGRGGGGFPTGIKWEAGRNAVVTGKDAANTEKNVEGAGISKGNTKGNVEGTAESTSNSEKNSIASEKFIVCNADEGDPGAFMDRSILEGDPHSVIEGMIIAGYAIGANNGYVYVRAEYPLAVERLDIAIRKAREAGLLGKNILGSGFDFDLEIRIGAGAFVCGEETALMQSIEGHRGEPKQKPPFPFQKGLFGKPTIINNVETFANIAPIILNGGSWYAGYGTEKSKGTKVFALAGDINNTGIVEVPMGITLGDIIFDIGGGIPRNKQFKAAQTGGPSGGCITKEFLNTPIDYDSLVKLGAIMGSGGLISMNEDTCMVDMARFFMEFVQDESCGKCIPCRLGTKRMLEILERITKGEGVEGDIELLEELGEIIKQTAVCGLGQTAPNSVLSMIKYFREEYEEHIKYKHCRAGVCGEMFISPCQNACPAGVNVPGYVALIAAGRIKDAYNLVRKENPFPAVCGRVCTHPCESKCRRAQLDEPISIADLKRYTADYVMKSEEPYMDLVFPKKGKAVAIIGAGPSGLTCGYYLARLGYDVEIFETQPTAGGILDFGIPEYRLPKEVLRQEIKLIEQVGVKIHTNTEIGKDRSFYELRDKFDAVYIATGTQFSNKINIPGEELKGVYYGLDFLRDVNLGKTVKIGDAVAVIGGGNTAIDAARIALRLGAHEVTILYRRLIEDMPADAREIKDAIEEGTKIIPLVAPIRFHAGIDGDNCNSSSRDNGNGSKNGFDCDDDGDGDGDGNSNGNGNSSNINVSSRVSEIECIRMELKEFDVSGRRKPKATSGSEFTLKVDMVIPAVSQYSDLPFIKKDEVEVSEWGTFITDKDTMMTMMKGVFAGGDVTRGSDVVIAAIADGKNAAKSIDRYLGGNGILNTGEDIEIPNATDDKDVIEHERFPMKYLDADSRKNNFDEVAIGFHKLNAMAEAMRCLRCDRRY